MTLSLISAALLTTIALAAPHPEIEVVQIRQVAKRQDLSSLDLSSLLAIPSDLSSLLGDLPSSLDLSSLLGPIETSIPSLPSACVPPANIGDPPQPGPALVSAIETYTDYCHTPSFTGAASSEYVSYKSAASSWYEEHGSEFSSWLSVYTTACPYATEASLGIDISSLIASYSVTLTGCSGAADTVFPILGDSTSSETGGSTTGASSQTGPGTGGSTEGESATSTRSSTEGPTSSGVASGSNNSGAAPQQTAFAAVVGAVAGFAGIVAVL